MAKPKQNQFNITVPIEFKQRMENDRKKLGIQPTKNAIAAEIVTTYYPLWLKAQAARIEAVREQIGQCGEACAHVDTSSV